MSAWEKKQSDRTEAEREAAEQEAAERAAQAKEEQAKEEQKAKEEESICRNAPMSSSSALLIQRVVFTFSVLPLRMLELVLALSCIPSQQ